MSAILFPVPPNRRAERSEILALLVGSLAVMEGSKDPIGRAYRVDLTRRIRKLLAREDAK